MLFGNESIAHYNKSNVTIWMALAFQAGLLNIGGYMACHRFVSHVTGFATIFGLEASKGDYSAAWGMLSVPLFFICGAMLAGQLVDIRLKLHKKARYYIVFGVMTFLIMLVLTGGLVGFFGGFGEPLELTRDYSLLALLCLICGIQNATITTVSRAIVRTTHLTGITTDLGIGIVRVLHRKQLHGHIDDDIKANYMRIGIISFFVIGSVLGGYLFANAGYFGFILPFLISMTLFGLTLYFQVIKVHHPRPTVKNQIA